MKEKLESQLAELEERAEELDKRRTGSISTISLINDRNRKDNISRAEKSIINEARLKEEIFPEYFIKLSLFVQEGET